jgi:enoyl-[acyl-carrier protein] reductase II
VKTRFTELVGCEHPIVQAGMSWASSSAALPIAVSRAGGLGVVAAGPLSPDRLRSIVQEVKASLGSIPFALNIPLSRADVSTLLEIVCDESVPVVIASQGGPRGRIERVHAAGARWFHVVAYVEHARKAVAQGADALVVVGAEAGGHPPPNEVGTLVLVRRVVQELSLPVIAGGGAADGFGVAALLALGADAVQLGTRFLLTEESTVHPAYKAAVLAAEVDGTAMIGKRSRPVRGLRNAFAAAVAELERRDTPPDEYEALLRSSSLKRAALEGDVEWGKVEAGQSAGLVRQVLPAADVMRQLVCEIEAARRRLAGM